MCDHTVIDRHTKPGELPQVGTCWACNRTLRRASFDVPWESWHVQDWRSKEARTAILSNAQAEADG